MNKYQTELALEIAWSQKRLANLLELKREFGDHTFSLVSKERDKELAKSYEGMYDAFDSIIKAEAKYLSNVEKSPQSL